MSADLPPKPPEGEKKSDIAPLKPKSPVIVKADGMMTTGVQRSAINWPEPLAPPRKAAPRPAATAAPAEGGKETEEQAKKRKEVQKKLDVANSRRPKKKRRGNSRTTP